LARVPLLKRRGFIGLLRACQFLAGLLAAWIFFYLIGESLLALPALLSRRHALESASLERNEPNPLPELSK